MEQVILDGPYSLTAEILRGDKEESGRIWVCVRHATAVDGAWMGCWSKPAAAGDGQAVDEILRDLAHIAETGTSLGPYGPVFSEHHFFAGWQTWGPGTPAPLMGLK